MLVKGDTGVSKEKRLFIKCCGFPTRQPLSLEMIGLCPVFDVAKEFVGLHIIYPFINAIWVIEKTHANDAS